MKKPTSVFAFILFLIIISFKPMDKQEGLLKDGDTVVFSNKRDSGVTNSSSKHSKGAYDGSQHDLTIDNECNIVLSNIQQANGPKQDEFLLLGCTGNLTKKSDQVFLEFEKTRQEYYLINLDNAALVGTFEKIVRIVLKPEDALGNPAEVYCPEKIASKGYSKTEVMGVDGKIIEVSDKDKYCCKITHINLTALPKGVKTKDLYVKEHKPETLAHFTKIEVVLEGGKTLTFPAGSYILAEGNSFSIQ